MAEIRRDPVTGRWVIIATERAARPHDFFVERGTRREGFCPFCEGNEDRTPPEIAAVRPNGTAPNTPGWRVRVVPNKFPVLQRDERRAFSGEGLFRSVAGFGVHEVVIESPRHLVSPTEMTEQDVAAVVQTYCDRSRDLSADERLAYVLIFKNVGAVAGASIEHTHSQLIAMPVMPKRVYEEMRFCMAHYGGSSRCLFCDIIEQELAAGERVAVESDSFVVLSPYAARFPFEVWLLPKWHSSHFFELGPAQVEEMACVLREALARLEICLHDPPYNFAIHTAPVAAEGTGCYHWHLELIPRVTEVAGFEWGTGFYINPMSPESSAQYLRDVSRAALGEKLRSECVAHRAGQ